MEVKRNTIESELLGRPVFDILEYDGSREFTTFEEEHLKPGNPIYVTCKVPAEQIGNVHALEDHGFRFVEFQIRLRGTLRRTYDTSAYNYSYSLITGPQDLEAVLNLASSIFEHDVSRDPFFQQWKGRNIPGERHRRYVMKSAEADDEFVYKLVNNATGEIVGFSTHRILTPDSALLLSGGVRSQERASGVGPINDYFALNELKRKGVKWFHTHVSGANYPIVDVGVRGMGFRVVQSFVVLRKVYPR